MLKADFTKYTLALIQGNKIIYSSSGHGLKPLVDCLENYRQTKEKLILHDKVTGLAAAKLAVYSGIISGVHTLLVSRPAKVFLADHGIELHAQEVVANILKKDWSSLCPGEVIALNAADQDAFLKQLISFTSGLPHQKM